MIKTPDIVISIKGKWDIDYYHYICKQLKILEKEGKVRKTYNAPSNYWVGTG